MGKARIKPGIASITPYEPGTSSHDVGRPIVKLSSNENPYGPSPRAVAAICSAAGKVNAYPDKEARALRSMLAARLGLPVEAVSAGNGSDDVLENLAKLYISEGDNLVTHSAFSTYKTVAQALGGERRLVPSPPEVDIDLEGIMEACDDRTRIILVCTPNNPTGAILGEDQSRELLSFAAERGIFVVLDEAYGDFSKSYASPAELILSEDLDAAVSRTFSKAYGLAGLRIGYCIAPPRVQAYFNLVRMPFNASSVAQAAAMEALQDEDFYQGCVDRIRRGRSYLTDELDKLGLVTYPSEANFVLVSLEGTGISAAQLKDSLLKEGFAIRDCKSFGLPDHARISVGTDQQNRDFVSSLGQVLG
jgi:histidinol-phosphate aminotransferase